MKEKGGMGKEKDRMARTWRGFGEAMMTAVEKGGKRESAMCTPICLCADDGNEFFLFLSFFLSSVLC